LIVQHGLKLGFIFISQVINFFSFLKMFHLKNLSSGFNNKMNSKVKSTFIKRKGIISIKIVRKHYFKANMGFKNQRKLIIRRYYKKSNIILVGPYEKFLNIYRTQRKYRHLKNYKRAKINHPKYGHISGLIYNHNIFFFRIDGRIKQVDLTVEAISVQEELNFHDVLFKIFTSNMIMKTNLSTKEQLEIYASLTGTENPQLRNIPVGLQPDDGSGEVRIQFVEPVFRYSRFKELLDSKNKTINKISDVELNKYFDEYDKVFTAILITHGILIKSLKSGEQGRIYILEKEYIAK
jgi:hypothetical protein